MTSHQRKAELYCAGNLEAAGIVAADRDKYPEGSLMAIWAELVLNPSAERSRPGRMRTVSPAEMILEAQSQQQ